MAPGMPYVIGNKQAIAKHLTPNDITKNFTVHKANSIKKVYLKPKVARLYNSTSPKKQK